MRWQLFRRTHPEPMSFSFDGLVPHDYPQGSGGFCRIRVFTAPNRPTVVIATELADSPGKSITYAAEELALDVCRRFDIDPANIRWVEHHTGRGSECFAWVDFGQPVNGRFLKYVLRFTTKKKVELVIRQVLAD